MKTLLEIQNLHVEVEKNQVLKGLNLKIQPGEIHAIMGPNGSGKSSLAKTIAGHPLFKVRKGSVLFDDENILKLEANERAKRGIFLAFQQPKEIAGVKFAAFLRAAQKARHGTTESVISFHKNLKGRMKSLHLPDEFTDRFVNAGFSGGEKKKGEILQMQILQPKLVILDEIDSGLDVDALKKVAEAIKNYHSKHVSILIITHYQRILEHIHPDCVHVMVDGKIKKSGGKEFAKKLEKEGYAKYLDKKPAPISLTVLNK